MLWKSELDWKAMVTNNHCKVRGMKKSGTGISRHRFEEGMDVLYFHKPQYDKYSVFFEKLFPDLYGCFSCKRVPVNVFR